MVSQYSLVFDRKKLGLTDSIIQIRVYLKGKYKYFNSGVKISRREWDESGQRVNHHHPNYIQLNKLLQTKIAELQEYELKTSNSGKNFRLEMLDNLRDTVPRKSLNEFIEGELEVSNLKQSTIRQQKSFLKKLNSFRPDIQFREIDLDFCFRYERFLIGKGLSQNSIHKEFKNIKKFLNAAIDKELFDESKSPFRKFRVKTTPTTISYITEDELANFENLKFSKDEKELEFIRDLYLLGVYTGLRYSDLINLKKNDLEKDSKDRIRIVLKMQKTADSVRLPINNLFFGKPLELIKKHSQSEGDTVFKYYTNQHINRMLKVLSKMASIKRPITFHTSRHTFGTILLNKGLPVEMVQKLMGHKRIQQTLEYAKIQTVTIENQLSEIFKNAA